MHMYLPGTSTFWDMTWKNNLGLDTSKTSDAFMMNENMVRISSFCHRKAELEVNQCKFKHAILSKSSYRRASSLILPNIFFSSYASRLLLSEFRSCHKSLYYSIQNLSQEAHRWPPLSSNHNLNKRAKIVIIHRVPGKNLWQDISKWMRCYWLVASPAPYLECSQTLIDLRYLGWEKALEGSMESTSQMSLHTETRGRATTTETIRGSSHKTLSERIRETYEAHHGKKPQRRFRTTCGSKESEYPKDWPNSSGTGAGRNWVWEPRGGGSLVCSGVWMNGLVLRGHWIWPK